jgi:hypothetical protein
VSERVCAYCDRPLTSTRANARYCSSPCRTEAWRLVRLLQGKRVGRYRSFPARLRVMGVPRLETLFGRKP